MEECQYQRVESTDPEDDSEFSWKYFFRQLLINSCIWNLFIVNGLYFGAPTVIIPQMRREANSTEVITDEMASWISSTLAFASVPWLIIMPVLSNYIGRKKVFIISSANVLISSIFFFFSVSANHLICTQIFQGIFIANQVTVCVIIISEYTSPKYRGIFLTLKTAMFGWGLWLSNAMGTFFHWRTIGIWGLVFGLYNCLAAFFWTESPYWLADKCKFEECSRSHRWLKGNGPASSKELQELIYSRKEYYLYGKNNNRQMGFLKRLLKTVLDKEFYTPYYICAILYCLYHFSGKIVCTIYAIEIIKNITENESTAYMGMLILDGITVLGMYTGSILSRYIKRRTLLLTTALIAVSFLYAIATYLYLIKCYIITENNIISILLLTAFSLSISAGPFILVTSLFGELTPLKSRTLFMILVGFVNQIAMGIILKMAPALFKALHLHGTFLFYAILFSVAIVLTYKFLPETKDKTLIEIENLFLDDKEVQVKPLIKSIPLEH